MVENAGHNVQVDRPDAVVAGVLSVVKTAGKR
jgi:pimeloyl-ACP methyl ester carboxylesterase